MKPIIAVLMMITLIFQSSWSMAAQLCQHETGVKTSHFGHHSHACHTGDNNEHVKAKDGSEQVLNHNDHINHQNMLIEVNDLVIPTQDIQFKTIKMILKPVFYQSPYLSIIKPPCQQHFAIDEQA